MLITIIYAIQFSIFLLFTSSLYINDKPFPSHSLIFRTGGLAASKGQCGTRDEANSARSGHAAPALRS